MMMRGVRLVSLFLGYGLVGFGGDYAVGLLGQETDPGTHHVVVDVDPVVEVDVDVDMDDFDIDVQVGSSGQCRFQADEAGHRACRRLLGGDR